MAATLVLLVLLCLSTALTCSGGGGGTGATGIRMKLTHVDAKGNYTAPERVRRAIALNRQINLASMRAGAAGGGGVSAPVHWATRQYIAEYQVGDPPQRAEALIDTGSNLIWTQCATCLRKVCARQDLPYFNASASSSFAPVPCRDRACAANDVHLCALDGSCTFLATYGAGRIIGSLGTDVFTFQSGGATLAFGCVSFTEVTPGALQGASGLIGLGRGRLSLASQTGAKRFSYCLTPYFHNNGASSHLFVGAAASLSGGGPVMSMPFVESPKDYPYSAFYYLPLVGITVGETKLPIPSSAFDLQEVEEGFWEGGVIIDSGSSFTSLVEDAYEPLVDELARQLNGSLVPPPGEDDGGMALCVARGDLDRVVPTLVLHFSGGADMALPPENYWAPLEKSTACMAIVGGYQQSIIGNFQQQNMHILFDVGGGRLSFQNADCSTI
ncbi:aspartic proteinase nepenthesin-1-like [Miscanthus floridulus]|uniref:aspartic proteinase nepenthesin-1-like n=1 Tax=Miscanthus floridulus TaxID=154761 RepID=UPI00345896D3